MQQKLFGTYYTDGRYKGRYAGTIGDYGVYSFNGNKIITTGGGGAVTSDSHGNVAHIRYLSTQAKDDPYYYIHNETGYNYRMTDVQGAMGQAQARKLDYIIEEKRKRALLYNSLIAEKLPEFVIPYEPETISYLSIICVYA